MQKKKLNTIEIISIIVIVVILGCLIIPSLISLFRVSNKDVFTSNLTIVYNKSLNQRKKDIETGYSEQEYNYQKSKIIGSNNYSVNYIANYDTEGNMTYLCVSDGKYYVSFPLHNKYVSVDDFVSNNVIESNKNCFEESDENER